MAYGILIFYSVLTLCCAAIGNYFNKKDGFSNGYIIGTFISLILWEFVGRKAANV